MAEIYKEIIEDSPIYFKDDQEKLETFLRQHVGKGKGEDILYQIEHGKVRPSKKLIDHVKDKRYASIGLFAWDKNPDNVSFYENNTFSKFTIYSYYIVYTIIRSP